MPCGGCRGCGGNASAPAGTAATPTTGTQFPATACRCGRWPWWWLVLALVAGLIVGSYLEKGK